MIRIVIALLCALGLAFAPVAAGAAAMSGDSMADCTMGKNMPGEATGHGKMDCCTPACQATSCAALLPSRDAVPDMFANPGTTLARVPVKELVSARSSGLDPPPRV